MKQKNRWRFYVIIFPYIAKSNNPPWVFFKFLKLYKWYQFAQRITYSQTNIYNIFDPKDLKFLTRLRLVLSHLNEHRFWHNFQDCLNPLCFCSLQIKNSSHYLLHCHQFSHHRVVVMNSVKSICDNFDSMSDSVKENLLLYGDSWFDENKNKVIWKENINYIKNTERFSESLFINVSSLINIQLFVYNSDHLVIKIFRDNYC